MPVGSTPCFPCVPGVGWQLKVQTETHSLSSEIKGFVCRANNQSCAHSSELAQRRRMTFYATTGFVATGEYIFALVHLLVQDR